MAELVRPEIDEIGHDLLVAFVAGLLPCEKDEILRHAFGKIDLVLLSGALRPILGVRKRHGALPLFIVGELFDVDGVVRIRTGTRRLVLELPKAVLIETSDEKADVVDASRRCGDGYLVSVEPAN